MPMVSESNSTADTDAVGLSTAQMKEVLEISRLLAITADLESLLEKLALATCRLLDCEGSSIWLYDEQSDELYTTVVIKSGHIRLPAKSGIVGAAFRSNSIVNVASAYDDPRFNPSSDQATGFVTRSLMATPMVDIHGKPIGVIEAVNKIGEVFTPQDESLVQLFADQAGVAIQRHDLQHVARQAAELQREIWLARNVQQALLPKKLPVLKGFDLFGWAKSASTTGGDCYDLWQLGDGRLGIFLADASGHGLGPALVVSQIRTLVRTLCDGSSKLSSPHEVMLRVNRRLSDDLNPEQFVTAFLGFLDSEGTIEWQSAGHGPILFRPACDAAIQALPAAIPPLNALDDLPDEPPPPLLLSEGGMLAVMSDGIFESFDAGNQLFGVTRVLESLQDTCHDSAATAVEKLVAVVSKWQKDEAPRDDQTIILVNRAMTRCAN